MKMYLSKWQNLGKWKKFSQLFFFLLVLEVVVLVFFSLFIFHFLSFVFLPWAFVLFPSGRAVRISGHFRGFLGF